MYHFTPRRASQDHSHSGQERKRSGGTQTQWSKRKQDIEMVGAEQREGEQRKGIE